MRVQKTIGIVITHPLRRDSILRTDMFADLAKHEDVRLVVMTHCLDTDKLEREFGGDRIFFESVSVPGPRSMLALLQDMRTIARCDPNTCLSMRYFYNQARADSRGFAVKHFFVRLLPARLRTSEAFWNGVERWFVFLPEYKKLFKRHRFSALLVPTPGMKMAEIPFFVYGRRNMVPMLAVDIVYDNLATKYFDCRHTDRLFAWSEKMKADIAEKRGVDPSEIAVVGAPRMDVYARPELAMSRSNFLKSIGLSPDKKLLTFLFSTQNRDPQYPPNRQFTEDILRLMRNNELGHACQLLIRLSFGDRVEDYRDLMESGVVAIDASMAASGDRRGTIDENDMGGHQYYFLNVLSASDVFINTTSSSTIEAACLDTPVVWLAYATDLDVGPLHLSLRDRINFHGHRWLSDAKGVAIVNAHEDLAPAIRSYLDDPALHSVGRRTIVAEQVGALDGQAGKRSAREIYDFIAKG